MPHHFEFDSDNQIARCRFEGRVTDEELKKSCEEIEEYNALTDPLACITDLSAVTSFEVSPRTILELAMSAPHSPESSRLRVIIATAPQIFGMARMFEIKGEYTRPNVHVVRSQEEASAILAISQPRFPLHKQ